jgi:dihydroorotase
MNLLIKNGRLIDPASGIDGIYHIAIKNGKIEKISSSIPVTDTRTIIDAAGLTVSPGFIDMHVHLREPGQEHKEDIETGGKAAVRGGFTSIACMPNTSPVNDNTAVTRRIIQRANAAGLVNIFPVAAVSNNLESKRLTDMEALAAAGVIAFSDDGRCVMSEALFEAALEKSKKLRMPVIEHPEDHGISQDGQVNEGGAAKRCGVKGIPASAEDLIIERDIRIQEKINAYLHLTHLSTAGSVRLIEAAKKRNTRVTADVTPHHLLLDDTALSGCDPVYKMKPPLRSSADRQALVEAIRTGVIDCIASDHAPHSPDEKAAGFKAAPFGVIGMETSFPVIHDRLVRTGIIDIKRLIELFAASPARILHLEGRGTVKTGGPADLTLLDLERPFKIDAKDFCSKSVNCPFIGWEGKGAVIYTIVNGKIVYHAGNTD